MTTWLDRILVLSWLGILATTANYIAYGVPFSESFIGMSLLIIIALSGQIIGKIIPIKIPVVCWIALIALLTTSPLNPYGAMLDKLYLNKINFLSIATAILTYAGLAVGKDLTTFRLQSWKIIIVALLVFTGTFVFSTAIAQVVLRLTANI